MPSFLRTRRLQLPLIERVSPTDVDGTFESSNHRALQIVPATSSIELGAQPSIVDAGVIPNPVRLAGRSTSIRSRETLPIEGQPC